MLTPAWRLFIMRVVIVLVALSCAVATLHAEDAPAPTPAAKETLDPTRRAHHEAAAEYNASHNGVSLLVLVKGEVVFEAYPNGGDAETAHELASGTKSFSGALAVAAVADKLLDLDEKVSKTLSEWATDPRKEKVTIRQLLSLTSGLDGGPMGRVPEYADAIGYSCKAEPGDKFQYGPVPFQTFGEVLKRKLAPKNETVLRYLHRRVLDPIGLKVARWKGDSEPRLPSGCSLTAREWAKFGELVRQRGVFKGERILDADLLDECFKGTKANPCYGLSFWLNRPIDAELRSTINVLDRQDLRHGEPGLPDDLVLAAGMGDQRLYVSRALDLVVVRQTDRMIQLRKFSDRKFLSRLLRGKE